MSEILIRNADHIVTMDDDRRELAGADLLLRDGVIAAIGTDLQTTGEVIEAPACPVTPRPAHPHHPPAGPAPLPGLLTPDTRCHQHHLQQYRQSRRVLPENAPAECRQ